LVSTPKPPDPMETAQAQGGMNRDTAITQQQLNMINQVGPTGTLTYNQTGVNRFKDSQGNWIETPSYTATTKLTPEQQAIFDQTQGAQTNLAGLANQQSGFLKDYLAKPFEYDNEDAEQWAYDLGSKRLDPRFAQEQEQLRSTLIASGIRPGTPAFDQQMGKLGETKNDAYNQLMLTGRQQAYQEALTERNQPLNEISGLLSGSQISQPQFQQTPQTGVGGVDYSGLVQSNYQAQLQNSQNALGGLFGLAGTLGMGAMKYSDRRLKTDIKRVGTLDNGLPVYSYRFGNSPVTEIGLMADEVEAFAPHAVAEAGNGFKMVDYRLATETA